VRGPAAGPQPGVGLDQDAVVVELDELTVRADLKTLPEVGPRHGVQRLADLDVEVAVDLHGGQDRHVIRRWDGQQHAGLVRGEDLGGPGLDRAVETHPGLVTAPPLRGFLGGGEVGERLPGPEVAPHVLHRPLHPGFVLRGTDPGRVGGEPGVLGVVQPPLREPRVHRVGVRDDRGEVVRDQDLEDPAEEAPRRLAARDDRGQGLGERHPDEHVPRVHRSEDQRVDLAAPPGLRVLQVPQVPEINLQFSAGLPISNPHRGGLRPVPAHLGREAMQRPIRRPAPLAFQQLVDLHQRQRLAVRTPLPGHPTADRLLPRHQRLPRRTMTIRAARPHRRNDRGDHRVVHRAPSRLPGQAGRLRGFHVPAGRLTVHPGTLGDRPQPGPCEPAPQHLPDLDHADLPESHAR